MSFFSLLGVGSGPISVTVLMASDLLSDLTAAEISVTGTVTATISRMHVCSGTASNYTVTLPAASGNTGKLIGFRMAGIAALSKLVTLDGNASETIDGATTRVMWAGEACLLLCDGSNWFKIAGNTIPMRAALGRSTAMAANIATATVTIVTLATAIFDNTGAMADTANTRITIQRAGTYDCGGGLVYDNATVPGTGIAATANAQARLHNNGTVFAAASVGYTGASWFPEPCVAFANTFAVGDLLTLRAYQTTGADVQLYADTVNFLYALETPAW